MKTGTSFLDRNNIRDFVKAGNTNAAQISERLSIKKEVVQRVIDNLHTPELTRGQKAAATRAANKAAQEENAA